MKDFFNQIHHIDEQILDEYISNWEEYKVSKKTVITAPGKIEKHLYFVLEGIQKAYYIKGDKQYIIAFTYNPSFSGALESLLTQTPSNHYLATITESKFLRISVDKHQQLMREHREIETFVRKATELALVGTLQRNYELTTLDITQRFKVFAKRSSHLFRVVPHKDLASYLNINPTNFSKLYNSIKI